VARETTKKSDIDDLNTKMLRVSICRNGDASVLFELTAESLLFTHWKIAIDDSLLDDLERMHPDE